MEYCEHGDLRKYLTDRPTLPEEEAQDITRQLLVGISLMHKAGFAHRDIKPAVSLDSSITQGDSLNTKPCRIYLLKAHHQIRGGSNLATWASPSGQKPSQALALYELRLDSYLQSSSDLRMRIQDVLIPSPRIFGAWRKPFFRLSPIKEHSTHTASLWNMWPAVSHSPSQLWRRRMLARQALNSSSL